MPRPGRSKADHLMRVYAVGANHSRTPVAVREALAVTAEQLPDALSSLLEHTGQGVLLSTCNRTEIYGVEQDSTTCRDAAVDFLCSRAGIPRAELQPYLYIHEGESAVRHLFRLDGQASG